MIALGDVQRLTNRNFSAVKIVTQGGKNLPTLQQFNILGIVHVNCISGPWRPEGWGSECCINLHCRPTS